MDFIHSLRDIEPAHLVLLLGILIVITTLLRQIGQRNRLNARKRQQHEAAIRAAEKAERQRRQETVVPKSKIIPPQTRLPLADPFATPFTGNIQGIAAKWEAEVHQIGRQIIGLIDSKMAALQAITLDANRTANRLEILVEHLEQIARQQIEREQNHAESAEHVLGKESSTVIPAREASSEAAPLKVVLKELADDLEGIHQTIKQSTTFDGQPEQATILRVSELQAHTLRREVEMLSNYGLDPQEIARRLNISLGEVDLVLQVQQNR